MAADVTLVSLPATEHNWWRARVATYHEELPNDDLWRDEDTGEVIAVTSTEERRAFQDDLHRDPAFRWFEIGPVSYLKAGLLDDEDRYLPGPTVAVNELWQQAQLVTTVLVTMTMVTMNRPDTSQYRRWCRAARRQHVKRWLSSQLGRICWAEVW